VKRFDFCRIGQLVRRMDLYEINVDNINRLITDPISRGVIVTDGGNKKIWAIGPEGEKKSIQYRPWRKNFSRKKHLTLFILIFSSMECRIFNDKYFTYFTCWLFNFSYD
jgi:hypothetical protein